MTCNYGCTITWIKEIRLSHMEEICQNGIVVNRHKKLNNLDS